MKVVPYNPLRVTPKRRLGSGGYKTCYTIEESRHHVVLVHMDSIFDLDENFKLIEEEARHLRKLASLGLPVAEITEIGTLDVGGVRHAAHVMPRYACGNRDHSAARLLRVFNERTLNDARELLSHFERLQPLYVDDLQFLFTAKGSMVIADPLWVERRYSTTHRIELTRIIKAAKYSLQVRRGGMTHPPRAPLWQSAELWQGERGDSGK